MTRYRTFLLILMITALSALPLAFPPSGDAHPLILPGHIVKLANFSAVPGDSAVTMSWDDPANANITGYQYRQQEGDADYGDWTDIPGSGTTTTSHTVSGLTNGAVYTFQVRAYYDSPFNIVTQSDAASATPTACANGTAVPDPGQNPGLVSDCTILLAALDTLAGTGTLDWSEDTAINDWQGVTVSGTPARVTAVNVADAGLTGTIPTGLGGLTNLTQLYLNNNELSGSIPPELGNLTNLTQLHLGVNDLSGSIPGELGGLTNLSHLHLDTNDLSGSIPGELGSLARLTYLDLGVNQLSGSIPPELGNLTNLTDLFLDQNQLTGGIPPELGNLTNLVWIRLGSNSFAADACVPPALSYIIFQDFEPAGLPFCQRPAQPVNFAAAPDDTAVALSWDDPGDASITGYQYRQQEGDADYGDWTDISGSGATTTSHTVSGLTNGTDYAFQVRAVNIWGQGTESDAASATPTACANGIAVPNPEENPSLVSDCTILLAARDTLAGDGTLNWSADTAMRSWQGLSVSDFSINNRLSALVLEGDELTGIIPAGLGGLTNLLLLDLSSNQLSGSIPPELGSLSRLNYLKLEGNQLTGPVPAELGSLTNLIWLSLNDNQLSGTIPPELGNLTNLTVLNLQENQLTGVIPSELGGLSSLENLYLSTNQLSGFIPRHLGNLGRYNKTDNRMVRLKLDNNQLSGAIPPELGNLTNLRVLDLSTNQLSGSIPAELGNLTNLTSFLLANNSFPTNTCIPSALSGITINDFEDTGLPFCTVPAAPRSLILVTTSSSPSTISVIWGAPDDGGTPITDYDVRYKTTDEGDWTNHPFSGIGTSATIDGLTPGLTYHVQIRATNAEGSGDWSVSFSILLPNPEPALVLRQHANGGWEITHDEPVNVGWIGVEKNDQISSAVVADGYIVELYEHGSYRGKKLTFVGPRTVTIGDLHAENMNDKVSSYKLYRPEYQPTQR